MRQLWAPWRIEYILRAEEEKRKGCLFCLKSREDKDEENLLLYRGKLNFVILNPYPYNAGHMLVAPYRHIALPTELTDEETLEHFKIVFKMLELLKKTFNPDGFNVGINVGEIAGAGIADHLHTHIVPRWAGDTSFMPVLSSTKVIVQALQDTYQMLRKNLQHL